MSGLKLLALEVRVARDVLLLAPDVLRAPEELLALRSLLTDWGGFSLIGRTGAREKWSQASPAVHIPCTTFPQARKLCKYSFFCTKCLYFLKKFLFDKFALPQLDAIGLEEIAVNFQSNLSGRANSKMPSGSLPMSKRFSSTRMVLAIRRTPSGV